MAGIARLAPGWRGEIIAQADESYIGLDVEIGDADNDGLKEIITASAPSSGLYRVKKRSSGWRLDALTTKLAQCYPCLGMGVEVVDLDRDGIKRVCP